MSLAAPLDLIRSFLVFTESENITAAAKKLGLSQPAVSVQLKRLEEILGCSLFSIQGKRKVLSLQGRILHEQLREDLVHFENRIDRALRTLKDPSKLELRVGARREVLKRVALEQNFEGTVHYFEMGHEQILQKLISHEIDIGLTYIRPDRSDLVSKLVFREGVKFVVSKKFLSSKTSHDEQIRSHEFLTRVPALAYKERDPPFLSPYLEAFNVRLEDVSVRTIIEDWYAILELVEQGRGYSLVPEGICLTGTTKHYEQRIEEKIIPKVAFYALYPSELKGVPQIADFIRSLSQES